MDSYLVFFNIIIFKKKIKNVVANRENVKFNAEFFEIFFLNQHVERKNNNIILEQIQY